MWWLIIPVTIYSAGIFALWVNMARRRGGVMPAAGVLPKVTVVVAARNEEKHITPLLAGLAAQRYPSGLLEIIVVNDDSTDRTPIVVSEYIKNYGKSSQHSFSLIYSLYAGKKRPIRSGRASSRNQSLLYNQQAGKKQAIRTGIEKASGDVILTTDADCLVGYEWVMEHALIYGSVGADMVLGEVFQKPGRSFSSHFGVFEFSALQAITESAVAAGHPVMCNAANMSFRREVYLRHVGELHPDLPSGDDMFLLHAVSRAGGVIRYAGSTTAAVETASAVTAAALLRQRARWASKTFHYRDGSTLTLAAATAACNAAVTAAAVATVLSLQYLPLVAALYGIRLLPDYLITAHNIKKRGEKMPLLPFLLSEFIYPFYFATVAVLSLLPSSRQFRSR